jgi:hypothetical protein
MIPRRGNSDLTHVVKAGDAEGPRETVTAEVALGKAITRNDQQLYNLVLGEAEKCSHQYRKSLYIDALMRTLNHSGSAIREDLKNKLDSLHAKLCEKEEANDVKAFKRSILDAVESSDLAKRVREREGKNFDLNKKGPLQYQELMADYDRRLKEAEKTLSSMPRRKDPTILFYLNYDYWNTKIQKKEVKNAEEARNLLDFCSHMSKHTTLSTTERDYLLDIKQRIADLQFNFAKSSAAGLLNPNPRLELLCRASYISPTTDPRKKAIAELYEDAKIRGKTLLFACKMGLTHPSRDHSSTLKTAEEKAFYNSLRKDRPTLLSKCSGDIDTAIVLHLLSQEKAAPEVKKEIVDDLNQFGTVANMGFSHYYATVESGAMQIQHKEQHKQQEEKEKAQKAKAKAAHQEANDPARLAREAIQRDAKKIQIDSKKEFGDGKKKLLGFTVEDSAPQVNTPRPAAIPRPMSFEEMRQELRERLQREPLKGSPPPPPPSNTKKR